MSAVKGVAQCGQGGSLDAHVRTFWHKNVGFFEIYGVSARKKGERVEPVRTFFGKGGGQGRSQGAPIEMMFQDFRLNFS